MNNVLNYFLRYKNIIIALAIFLVFVLIDKSIVSRYYSRVKELDRITKEEIEKKKILLPRLKKAAGGYDKLKGIFFEDSALFKRSVDEAVRAYGITIKSLRPSQVKRGLFTEAAISLNFSASYKSVLDFINALEKKNIQIGGLSIGGEGEEKAGEITLKGFIFKEEQ